MSDEPQTTTITYAGWLAACAEIDRLLAERDALARWKAEATMVLAEWDEVYVALGEPGALGESKARASLAAVAAARAEAARLRGALDNVQNTVMDLCDAALTPPTDQGEGA